MFHNMDQLKILNFVQYRRLIEVLFKGGFEHIEPNFHAREKLELYKSLLS